MTVYNKVEIDNVTYIDLSQDTVASSADIVAGKVGHLNDGTQVTGTHTCPTPTLTTKSITANGTYNASSDNADGYSSVTVTVSGSSMNVQVAQSTTRATSSTYTEVISLTCSTAGKYDVYWDCFRSSTGGTSGSQLYIGGTEYGAANTSFTNHIQTNHLTNITLTANQTVSVYARSRGSNYYAYVGTLVIKQTA